MYMIIKGSEDGTPISLHSSVDVERILTNPLEWGSITEFRGPEWFRSNQDTNYWPPGIAVLIKYDVVVPKPVTQVWTLP